MNTCKHFTIMKESHYLSDFERGYRYAKTGEKVDFETVDVCRCNGTKERDICTCDGDPRKCDFYPEKRKQSYTINSNSIIKNNFLFRGQTRRFGEILKNMKGDPKESNWVIGTGVFIGDGDFSIIYTGDSSSNLDKTPVYTGTLTQYTGIDDIDGNYIFVGDILKTNNSHLKTFAVGFGSYEKDYIENFGYYLYDIENPDFNIDIAYIKDSDYKVVDNIFDRNQREEWELKHNGK